MKIHRKTMLKAQFSHSALSAQCKQAGSQANKQTMLNMDIFKL
jgi:hypothetical protein